MLIWFHKKTNIIESSEIEIAKLCLDWANNYIGKSHKELGRNGAICPFVKKSIKINKFYVSICNNAKEKNSAKNIFKTHVKEFSRRFKETDIDSDMNSLLVVYPKLKDEHMNAVTEIHTELKSELMHRGMMVSQFHPGCEKSAVRNEKFKLYQAPFPCIVLRYMGIHDIVFVSHNKKGFLKYNRLFKKTYETNSISNEQGYIDLFNESKKRFLS